MVVKTINQDIFETEAKHIAFAINTEGYNDAGFAGAVASKFWPELAICGEHELGTVLSKTVGDKTYHALVCHSLHNGWGANQEEIIRQCFDNIPANGELISSIAIGTGFVGQLSGANFGEIFCGMHDSVQQIMIHAGFSLEEGINYYNEHKQKKRRK